MFFNPEETKYKDIDTISLLDFGAGCAHLNDYIVKEKLLMTIRKICS